ncbi:P4 family phage/plasmid primase-like protien [Jatrophihabitans sp. GAS493]|uniref:DNA polymerase n=1 Tax=Jatrophihabitans sp. GAS493 TaxID=1907575 RepID=UPI000BBF5355|nr:DNA polymerase [Jatrophihabitans sp. GAS493]SOD72742.1 P4 family phage/plasmid primase-like protien [Jatrophihabitans sp. GAS493]
MTQPVRPFADSVLAYHQAGWPIVPVPPETKTPPPRGFTGADGVDAEPEQLVRWATSHATSSVAIRMPEGVIGIDVDDYIKGDVVKHGAGTLGEHITLWGDLPPTWSSTARGPGLSRIYFYRVPAQRYATVLGPDVEIIQRHHRYAVVWPSVHVGVPKDLGGNPLVGTYTWYDPQGQPCEPPKTIELPELPQAWVAGLAEGAAPASASSASRDEGEQMWSAITSDERPACAHMASALLDAYRLIEASTSGTRHDAADDRAWNLVQIAADGHPGLGVAFDELTALWEQVTAGEDRGEEWLRLFITAARKAVTRVGRPTPVDRDPCFEAMGLTLVPAPTPGAAPGEEPAEPIAPAQPWSVGEHIGVHLFDPHFGLDQPLAQTVLERMSPVMRYAYDSNGWLRRGPECWEDLKDLSGWAMTEVAKIMPHGDPDAEKGSDARDQADRRKRFMTSSSAKAIGERMKALLAGGTHPCSVAMASLDRDPWVLWAGGIPWDLTASADVPTIAGHVDPATPHLRAAAVAPHVRPTPLWDAFTAAVWPDPELRAWALRVLSIAVTGDAAKALPLLVGEGDRGKTQIVVLIMSVLGSYAHAADPRLLGGTDKAHASIVTALKGRRLSFIDEAPKDAASSQERLKQLTGGGELTGNDMGRNPITFTPTHTLVLTANEAPKLTDPAVRRRVRLIPCEGDPAEVIAARKAIGNTHGAAWRNEAPGVLAKLMAEASRWLADETTGRTDAAPEKYRYRAEEIAAEQNLTHSWMEAMCEPFETGTASHELHAAFVGWCKDQGIRDTNRPSMTKWGTELNRLGYPAMKRRHGHVRALRIRITGNWASGAGLGAGFDANPAPPDTPVITDVSNPVVQGVQGVQGIYPPYTHAHTHTRIQGQGETTLHPCNPAQPGEPCTPVPANPAESAKITAGLLAAREAALQVAPIAQPAPAKPTRTKVDPAVRAAEKAAAKAQALAEQIAEASGPVLTLPTLVSHQQLAALELADVAQVVEVFGLGQELTVDVEHTGYPIGHADYQLRTVQVGNDHGVLVFDATDPAQLEVAGDLVNRAEVLHAHSATADLVPLAIADAIDIDSAWTRMHDTAIQALIADPQSTGSDADGLKQLAHDVLGDQAASTPADAARAALFKAGKWLTNTKATTPVTRSGWAQVNPRSTTMIRYAASDVLDTAALAKALPQMPSVVRERERTAQRMTARVAHQGVRLDGEHIDAKLPEHQAALAEAAGRLAAFGIDNAGSDQQIAAALVALGAPLPRTKTGRPSVARSAIEGYKTLSGPIGDLVRARLDYQHHETVLGLFLEPYAQLVHRGDGRARPTVYTLGADTGRMSCIQSDALVDMPRDLIKYPGGVPITEVKAGDWVYAFDHNRELVLRRVKWCEQTAVRETVIITAENSDGHQITLRATPDHLVRLRNGDWRAAGNLMHAPGRPHRDDGPRLMTMVKRIVDDGYVKFFPHSIARKGAGTMGGGKNREHRWVLEQIAGRKISTKVDVNHIDGNRANNHPSNLEELPMHEHRGNRDLAWGVEQAELNLSTGPNDYRVISVTPGIVEPVWDMEVDEVHNFIANGICVHNCVRPNLQQVPRQGGIRRCITADPGYVIASADFASVEVRVAAALSGDLGLQQMLAQGVDLHGLIAREVYGPDATKEDRYNTKRGVFGRLYGSGIPGIARTLGISETLAASTVDVLDSYTPQLAAWTQGLKQAVQRGMTTYETYSGRVVHLDQRLPHKALNYCVQGTARELLVDTLIRWQDTRWADCVLMPVHDELLVFVPESDAEEATAALVAAMETTLMGVAIKAEASSPSTAWSDAS